MTLTPLPSQLQAPRHKIMDIELSQDDGDEAVEVDVVEGEEVVVALEGSGGSGYMWQQELASTLDLASHEVVPDGESFGGGGTEIFTYRPGAVDTYEIRFALQRPWESKPVMVKTLIVRSHAEGDADSTQHPHRGDAAI